MRQAHTQPKRERVLLQAPITDLAHTAISKYYDLQQFAVPSLAWHDCISNNFQII